MSIKKVYIGLSGGVDSSVSAALLKQQGYNVVGVYMKNWSQDLPGFDCPWQQDFQDAKRVAVQLGIDFKMYDFETQYRQKVVDYMVKHYQDGLTPNPDIMCNQEVKFKLFLEAALEDGADMIATGHYARIEREQPTSSLVPEADSGTTPHSTRSSAGAQLLRAVDENKDQTYFLYRITKEALAKTLFPLGNMTKPEVRKKAQELGLITAAKKDSVGICFVGKVGIKEFLLHELGPQPAGDIVDVSGKVVGQHDGAIFYTIGQRHGLNVGGGLPYYVTGKDMAKNEVYVTTDLNDHNLWNAQFKISNLHWINQPPKPGQKLLVRTRHRAPLIECTISTVNDSITVKLKDEIRALTPGQSAVLYDGQFCLGGGIIT